MGEYTTNEYFYKPAIGASGQTEKDKFDDALDDADAEIKLNNTHRTTVTGNPHAVTKTDVGLSNVTNVAQLPSSYLDTDGTLAANSDVKVPSQKAVKTYADTKLPTASKASGSDVNTGSDDTKYVTSKAITDSDVLFSGGALGTPSSGTLTNCTFPTLNQNTSGTAAGLSSTLAVTSGGTGLNAIADKTLLVSDGANTLKALAIGAGQSVRRNAGDSAFEAYTPSAGGATTALDNLASVAINTSLISDTDNTDDLGSSSKEWKDLYVDGTAYVDAIDFNGTAIASTGAQINGLSDGTVNPTNLISNGDFEAWSAGASVAPDGWTLYSGNVARESSEVESGTYSAKFARSGTDCGISQAIHAKKGINYYKGKTITVAVRMKSAQSNGSMYLSDGVRGTLLSTYTGGSGWQTITATKTIDASATGVTLYVQSGTADGDYYIDSVQINEGSSAFAFSPKPAEVVTSTAASTGVGTVKMGSGNAANSAGWLKVQKSDGTWVYLPYWTTAVP